ncbi:hypothetical protein Z517_05387 [Fonsecaea pedrosoi CBS 271.37]|uniref:Agmatinase n=1 Tax=Fonsecaea pedrosoi CBS 271.37 TaxID=1442368 RepID=A0A0D2GUR1_9EURO|nr:uncharacterized protein Z517_05387 [Fonsecaea pedrosoi CBS 271.37]KIW82360.1 hypothetical protein Z517_05387 [Fonsecaea pedrosoi CBS 271.37]
MLNSWTSTLFLLSASSIARDITFPPVSPLQANLGSHAGQYRASVASGQDPLAESSKYSGLTTFANLPWLHCLSPDDNVDKYDIAFLGAPFDTGTSARPGARFGPTGIRWGSRRIQAAAGWDAYTHENTFLSWARIVDCGDAPLTFLDNTAALQQLEKAHRVVSGRTANATEVAEVPRIITLGGDHTTTLAALRSTISHWGPVSVIHFDSHIDTWDITARDIDKIGVAGIIDKLKARVGDTNVYISVDIDVLDPAYAPATGTAEVGGWTTRELLSILDGLEGVKVIGADVVEVAPIYDNPGETTGLAAAEVAHRLMNLMVETPVKPLRKEDGRT